MAATMEKKKTPQSRKEKYTQDELDEKYGGNPEQREKVRIMKKLGLNNSQIGRALELSRERIRQIVTQFGY
jgi:DNA-directed RNA polymerase sigma subunit (sigma70/sigma32)